jgi:hypothetical protein
LATWDPVSRVNRDLPQGAKRNLNTLVGHSSAALPGVGLFAWGGQRESSLFDAMFNHQVHDGDLDGSPVGVDCDDSDPDVQTPPGEVVSVNLSSATCLQDDEPDADWADPRPDPTAGTGYYYLVREQNVCGTGSYGTDSALVDRLPGDPCP